MKITKGEFKTIGVNEIDVDLVVSDWSCKWCLSEGRCDRFKSSAWKLIKHHDKECITEKIKTRISATQAFILVRKLDLKEVKVDSDKFSWHRKKDIIFLQNWANEKPKIEKKQNEISYRDISVEQHSVGKLKDLLDFKDDPLSSYCLKVILSFEKAIIKLQA